MRELPAAFPDPQLITDMAPEELAAKILFLLRRRLGPYTAEQTKLLSNEIVALWPSTGHPPSPWTSAHLRLRNDINLAISEAWAWLVAQGLLVPSPTANSGHGWYVLSRRAKSYANEQEFASFQTSRLLPKQILHARLSQSVWSAFMRGEYDMAVLQAFKAVEVSVREASGLANEMVGVALMRKAFHPGEGRLTAAAAEGGERQARMDLFAGAIGSYKNPQSHRDVNIDDPAEATELIMLANHLLRIVDARATHVRTENTDPSD